MSVSIEVPIQILEHGRGLDLPFYATSESAGMDIPAALLEDVTLLPGERKLIPSGFCLALPTGFEAQIRSRSGLSFRQGVVVLNAPGTIDADYRGEVGVILVNLSNEDFVVEDGERIAQLVVAKCEQATFVETNELSETERGAGGFGSTGVK